MFLNNTQTRASIGLILVGILLSGCATPKHALPEVQDNRVSAAAAEINAAPDPVADSLTHLTLPAPPYKQIFVVPLAFTTLIMSLILYVYSLDCHSSCTQLFT